jgi:dynein cytoplasmic 1 heavy chain
MGMSQWIPNLSTRLAQLETISQLDSFVGVEVWLGGLFFPEAYVTVTRQTVARRNAWSFETLMLKLDLGESGDPSGFVVEGTFFVRDFQLPMLIYIFRRSQAWS